MEGVKMTELKRICPFCGGEMIGTNGHPICHYNPDCIIHDESIPQELLDLLADTKKKLDICVKALNKIANTDIKVIKKEPLYYARAIFSVTNNTLGRIQDIEQKDVK